MENITNPVTGEIIPNTIPTLAQADLELRKMEKSVAEARQFIKSQLYELLEDEPNEFHDMDTMSAKIVRPKRIEFNLDKVLDLLGNTRRFVNEKNQEVDLYKPVSSAVKAYIAKRLKDGELTDQEAEQYKDSFEEKQTTPYAKVEVK